MFVTAEDHTTIRRMIVNSGYTAHAAAYEMSTRGAGRDYAPLLAVAEELAAEARGNHRPPASLPSLKGALARRASVFGPYDGEAVA